jgi:hypothetical protein
MREMHQKNTPATGSNRQLIAYNRQLPNVVTAVASGDHIYIASSMKGDNILYGSHVTIQPPDGTDKHFWQTVRGVCHPQIDNGLRQCEKTLPNDQTVGHQNGGSCGEVMVAWAMCDIVGDAHLNPGKVVAVQSRGDAMMIKDPCGDDTPGVSFPVREMYGTLQANHMYRPFPPRAVKPSTSISSGEWSPTPLPS